MTIYLKLGQSPHYIVSFIKPFLIPYPVLICSLAIVSLPSIKCQLHEGRDPVGFVHWYVPGTQSRAWNRVEAQLILLKKMNKSPEQVDMLHMEEDPKSH